ncbi:MAG: triose-phosphate isomerase [Chitinophagaceae bacterium]|nr:MAG: triose-phosphate isomerase [Chitinophagaceae bacterium]
MRKQIAAANWKMNLTLQQGETLLDEITAAGIALASNQQVIFAVPSPYLPMAEARLGSFADFDASAQNIYHKESGAYTGEISAAMLVSLGIKFVVIGHSERREYFSESNADLAAKVDIALKHELTPIFCCGEPLEIREKEGQNAYVAKQLEESLFHLSADDIKKVVIAYEPIWAIGTGRTASTEQAQEIHAYLRSVIAKKYSDAVAGEISILYGGSVKAANAVELFSSPDVDGGLVGGASLIPAEFIAIIKALK